MTEIDLGEFMKFCKDFQIPLHKTKQQEIFKKSCYMGHKPLKIEQFEQAIARLGVAMNQMRIVEINQKLKLIQEQLRNGEGGGGTRRNNNNHMNENGLSQMDYHND